MEIVPTRLFINYSKSEDLQPAIVAILACVTTKLALAKESKIDKEKMLNTTIHLKKFKNKNYLNFIVLSFPISGK